MNEKIKDLHEKFFLMCNQVKEAQPALTQELSNAIMKNLYDEYAREYAILKLEEAIEDKQRMYRYKLEEAYKIPKQVKVKRRFFRKPKEEPNDMARLIMAQVGAEMKSFFERAQKELFGAPEEASPEPLLHTIHGGMRPTEREQAEHTETEYIEAPTAAELPPAETPPALPDGGDDPDGDK